MPLLARRGFTLIELVIALLLVGIVSAGIYRVLVSGQRTYLAQTRQIDLQQNLRAAATILPAELRQIDAGEGDIAAMGPDSIRTRVIRQLAFLCATPLLDGSAGPITLAIRQTPIYGARTALAADDSLLVYYEGDATTRDDDGWVRGRIRTVAAVAGGCPDAVPGAAYVVTLDAAWLAGSQVSAAGAITNGSPVLGFDQVTYRVYRSSDNAWYLGIRDPAATGTTQPLAGPLIGSNGVRFDYYDATGNLTADVRRVARIDIALRARTAVPIRNANGAIGYRVDSVVTSVALRNNPRCGAGSFPLKPCQ